jgi:hypothetical protein
LTVSEKGNAFGTPDFTHILFFITRGSHSCTATLSTNSKKMRVVSVALLKFINVFVKCMAMHAFELERLLSFNDGHVLDRAIW